MTEYQKGQSLRIIDVVILAPYLIYLSRKLREPHRSILLVTGILTAAYNGRNYLLNLEREKVPPAPALTG
ncbi:hypothetical protein EBZ80_07195 [bacterium]|nr:hypothetical protein [bacterium]